MSRQVTHDGRGSFQIRFPFDRRLVDRVKTLPNRRWHADERFWSTPEMDVVELVELLQPEGFRFDRATRDLYSTYGGRLALETQEPSPRGATLPGLFDGASETPADDAASSALGEATDYTISGLNEQVKAVLEAAFPAPIWLVGEISGFNKSAHRKHVGFQLAERDPDGKVVSEVSATLFDRTRREIQQALAAVGNPFQLEDEVTVRMRVRVELHVAWGSYRVIVDELDVNYTLGEAARRREEIIRRLTEAGLVERNTSLPFPDLPLRVGLVTSLGSDAFNDVRRTLQESGFAFQLTAHGARVQGRQTEPSVLNALDWFRARFDHLDVVLICRGGGARTDLAWFDSEALGRAVADFPLPVVVGIGHEQDRSVLDAVGWRCKTPTAAASLLVETVRGSLERLERDVSAILEAAVRSIREERQLGLERGRRLARAASGLLAREKTDLAHQQSGILRGTRRTLEAAGRELDRRASAVLRAASVLTGRQRALLDAGARQLLQGARRDLATATRKLVRTTFALRPADLRLLGLERERTGARSRRVDLVHPRRVVERGYAILRVGAPDGERLLTEPADAPAGRAVRAELRGGALRLTSEGKEN